MADVAVIACLVILAVAVISINCVCLVLILMSGREVRASTLLITSLLVAHILQGVFVIPLYTAKRWEIADQTADAFVCTSFRFTYLLTNYVSCITVLILSVDRFVAIYRPLEYRVKATRSIVLRVIAFSWAYALGLCSIPFARASEKCYYIPSKLWTILMLFVNTGLPFIIIIILYCFICHKSHAFIKHRDIMRTRQAKEAKSSARKRSRKLLVKLELAAVKVAILISISYIICWGPSFGYYLTKSLCPQCFSPTFKDSEEEKKLNYAMKFLTMIDGLAAPIIYCLQNTGIRTAAKKRVSRMMSQRSLLSEFKSRQGSTSATMASFTTRGLMSGPESREEARAGSPSMARLRVMEGPC